MFIVCVRVLVKCIHFLHSALFGQLKTFRYHFNVSSRIHLYLQEMTRIPLDEKALALTTHFKYLQDATKFFNVNTSGQLRAVAS